MRRRYYYLLAKSLSIVLLLALIPILLVIRFGWVALLPIIIYLQFLLIWAQAEIGLRQHILFSAQFDPSFDMKLTKKGVADAHLTHNLFIRNTSKNPAYNIKVERVESMFEERTDQVTSYFISSLAPDQEILLCSLDKDIVKDSLTIEFSYTNRFGHGNEIHIEFFEDEKFWLTPGKVEAPGILLNTFEFLCYTLPKGIKEVVIGYY